MIEPKIGHIVNWKDEDGKWHRAGQVIYKETGFNYEGQKEHYILFPMVVI